MSGYGRSLVDGRTGTFHRFPARNVHEIAAHTAGAMHPYWFKGIGGYALQRADLANVTTLTPPDLDPHDVDDILFREEAKQQLGKQLTQRVVDVNLPEPLYEEDEYAQAMAGLNEEFQPSHAS